MNPVLNTVESLPIDLAQLLRVVDACPAVLFWCRYENGALVANWVGGDLTGTTGWSPQQVLQSPDWWRDGLHPDDRDAILARIAALPGDEFQEHEYRFRHRDGSYRWFCDKIRYLGEGFDRAGQVVRSWLDITERKQAAVDASQLAEATDVISDGIALFDADDRLVRWNEKFTDLFPSIADLLSLGITYEELLRAQLARRGFTAAVGREEDWIAERLQAHRNSTGAVEQEFADGRWVRLAEYKTPSGYILSLRTDITDLKRREQELHASREGFRDLVEGSIQGLVIHRGWTPVFANKAYAKLYGYDEPEEILATGTIEPLFAPHEIPRMLQYRAARLRGDEAPSIYEIEGVRRDGTTIWTQNSVRLIEYQGEPAIQCTVVDITDLKLREAELRASEARISSIMEMAPEAIISVDAHQRIIIFNHEAENVFGYSTEELLGQPLDILIPSWARKSHGAHMRAFAESFTTSRLMTSRSEIAGLRKDGSEFPAEASISTLELAGEKIFTVMLRDITQRKHMESEAQAAFQQAKTANAARAEFLAKMSHELRTPLNAVIGFAEIMRTELFGPLGSDSYKAYVQDIESSGQHLLQVINDILDLARIDSGKIELQEVEIDVNELLEWCRRILIGQALEKNLSLTIVPSNTSLRLMADQRLLQQVVINLMSNAVKFTPDCGRIDVGAKTLDDGSLAISIHDTGIGISDENMQMVFEPFSQADNSLTRSYEGTGLGLPVSKSLVELHGGTIEMTSTPGQGTTVTVRLPADRILDGGAVATNFEKRLFSDPNDATDGFDTDA
jgi:PAS domain S-box-containing protein